MMLILLTWLASALSRSSLLPLPCSAAPTLNSGVVRLHRAPESVTKDSRLTVYPADVHPQKPAAATHQQFLLPKDVRLAHISAVETPKYPPPVVRNKGGAEEHVQQADAIPSLAPEVHLHSDELSPSTSVGGSKQTHFSPFAFLQESPVPSTVILIVVGTALLLLLIVIAIISHYALASRSSARRGSVGYPRQQQYNSQSDPCETSVPAFNPDVFSAAVAASRQFSPLNSFNSLYNLPPGFIERKTPREIEYERRVMNTRLAPHSDSPQRTHSRHLESPPSPREGKNTVG